MTKRIIQWDRVLIADMPERGVRFEIETQASVMDRANLVVFDRDEHGWSERERHLRSSVNSAKRAAETILKNMEKQS